MKKLLKIAAVLAAIFVVLALAVYITLRVMFPAEKLKSMAQNYVRNNFHRELTFSKVSFNIVGVTIHDVALSEANTFEQGTFLKADHAVIKLKLIPLLHKSLDISTIGLKGLELYTIHNADGTFNFDDLLSAEEKAAAETAQDTEDYEEPFFAVLAKNIYAKNCNVYYTDLGSQMKVSIEELNLDINNFDLGKPFDAKLQFTVNYSDPEKTVSLPIKSALTVNLANLNNPEAYATLQNLSSTYKDITVNLKGGVKDFTRPIVNLQGTIAGISSDTLAEIAPDLPHFDLPDISFNADAEIDLDQSMAQLAQTKLSIADSFLTATGKTGWGGEKTTYNIKTNLNLDLSQLETMTKLLDGYGMAGKIIAALTATEKNDGKDVKGTVELEDVTIKFPPITLSQVSSEIVLTSLSHISSKSVVGHLNNEPFTGSFTYKDLGKVLDFVINADFSKLTIADWGSSEEESKDTAATQTAQTPDKGPETLFNLNTNINIGPIEIPHFSSQGAKITTKLTNASGSMKQANGTVTFNVEEGSLNDLFTSLHENKLVTIILLPLRLVQKVTSTLGINVFPVQDEKDKGKIKMKDASGTYVFTDGVMNLQETHLDSALSNISADGNINFKTEALDMHVKASVLTSQTPVVIKIGGTMSNPSGKLDVTKTAVSLVTGIVNYKTPGKVASSAVGTATGVTKSVANTGADAVKNTVSTAASAVKSISGLFKRKSTEEESTTSSDITPTETTQQTAE